MTPAELAAYVRQQTRTNATTFTDAQILVTANVFMDDIAKEIAKVHKGFFGRDFTYNLVASQRYYPLDDGLLNSVRSVEAKLDGTKWLKLLPTDLNSVGIPMDETSIRNQFTGRDPHFEIWQKKIWIYSGDAITSVTGGLLVRCEFYPKHLTDLTVATDMSVDPSSTERGFPRQCHELLARRVIIAYKDSKDKPIALTQTEQMFARDLALAIQALADTNQGEEIVIDLPFNDGSQF